MSRPGDPNAKIDLLRAAEAVFVERGLDHARVEEITGRAGHSKGAFYLHFANKEEVFRQIIESVLARMFDCIDQPTPDLTQMSPREVLRNWLDHDVEVFNFIWNNRRLMRLLMQGGRSASFAHLIDAFAERTRAIAVEGLRRGIQAGLLRPDLDVELASLVLSGGYDRVARHVVNQEKRPDIEALCAGMQRLILAGMWSGEFPFIDAKVRNADGGRSR